MFYAKPRHLEDDPIGITPPDEPKTDVGDVFSTSVTSTVRGGTTIGGYFNLYEAFDQHNRRIKSVIGVDLPNPALDGAWLADVTDIYEPWAAYKKNGGGLSFGMFANEWRNQKYHEQLSELATKHPEHAGLILSEGSFVSRGYARAREADAVAADTYRRSRGSIAPWLAQMAGGMAGAMLDPVNIATAPLGYGAVGTGIKGLAAGFLKGGALNAATEAMTQPFVQSYRAQAGLDYGLGQAAEGVATAFAAGGLLDAGVRGLYRGAQWWRGYVPVVQDGLVVGYRRRGAPEAGQPMVSPTIPPELAERAKAGDKDAQAELARILDPDSSLIRAETIARADAGDIKAMREVAEKTGAIDDPVARQLLDAAEANEIVARRPPDVGELDHAVTVTQALRHAASPDSEPPPVRVDTVNATRMTEAEVTALAQQVQALRGDVVGLARLVRETQARIDDDRLPISDADVRTARALAALSEDGFALAVEGKVPPEMAAMVADHVADPSLHGRMLDTLSRDGIRHPDHARHRIGELLQSPDFQPKVEDAGPAPGLPKKALDDPYGSDAKKQVAALEQQLAEELGRKQVAETPVVKPPEQVAAERAQAIDLSDRIKGLVREVLGVSAEDAGVTVRTFSSAADVPSEAVRLRMEEVNRAAYAEGVDRLMRATDETERLAARRMMAEAQAGQRVQGFELDGEIWVAAYAANPKAYVAHELVHALRRMGKMTADEIGVLAERARKLGYFDKDREAQYRATYEQQFPGEVEARLTEEAAAHLIERYFRGEAIDLPSAPAGVLDRLSALLADVRARLMEALGLKGADVPPQDAARQIIAAFTSGEIAKRQVEAEQAAVVRQAMRENDVTALAVREPPVARILSLEEEARTLREQITQAEQPRAYADPETGQPIPASEIEAYIDLWRYVQEMRRAKRPTTLSQWLTATGRVQDQGGELTNILGGKARYLISGKGRNLDDAARAAYEAGFFTGDRPDIREFLEALDDDVRGNRRVRQIDMAIEEEFRVADDIAIELDRFGIPNARTEDEIRAHFAARESASGAGTDAQAAGQPFDVDAARARLAYLDLSIQSLNDSFMAAMSDLDMSPSARKQRAEAMGFDTSRVLYHGTGSDIEAFSLRRAQDREGRRRGLGLGKGKIYLTGAAESAGQWAMQAPDRGLGQAPNVIPVYVRGKLIDESAWQAKFEELSGGKRPYASDLSMAERDAIIARTDAWAKQQGYAGIQQVYRDYQTGRVRETGQVAMFNTSDIRSINAAFDPRQSDSPNLMFAMSDRETTTVPARGPWGIGASFSDRVAAIKKTFDNPEDQYRLPLPWPSPARGFDLGYDQAADIIAANPGATKLVKMADLVAWNDNTRRADVRALTAVDARTKAGDPVVIRYRGNNLIVDGHHRLMADLLLGKDTAQVKFIDADQNLMFAMSDSDTGRSMRRAVDDQRVRSEGQAMFAFAGERAKTADLAKLARAKEMDGQKIDRTTIWNETGWFRGVDGKWRFEIDDSEATYTGEPGMLPKVISHKGLTDAYPQIDSFGVHHTDDPSVGGRYEPTMGALRPRFVKAIDRLVGYTPPSVVLGPKNKNKSTLLHELQHGVQDFEGTAMPSGYPYFAGKINEYERMADEVEARTVEKRMNLTPAQRAARPPWLDYDVPEDQQIVRFANGTGLSMFAFSEDPPVPGPAMRGTVMFAIKAYHGSPHDFDRFDMRKIGTGEGAQAYGHGLYFAEAEDVAKQYRENLTRGARQGYAGAGRTDVFTVDGKELPAAQKPVADIAAMMREFGIDPNTADGIDWLQREVGARGLRSETIEQAKSLAQKNIERKSVDGRLYEVRINADPDDFLDWDKPLSQQSEKVRGAIGYDEQAGNRYGEITKRLGELQWQQGGLDNPEWTSLVREARAIRETMGPSGPQYQGEEYARSLLDAYGKQGAAQKMRDAGIPGIRYLDQGSRSSGEGSRNYVIFDDRLIEIVAKDGQPVTPQDRADIVRGMTGRSDPDSGSSEAMFAMGDMEVFDPPRYRPDRARDVRGSGVVLKAQSARVDGFPARHYFVLPDGDADPVGFVTVVNRGDGWEVAKVEIQSDRRGEGLASKTYDTIETDIGAPMRPSGSLSDDGYGFWSKRAPELVKHHRQIEAGMGWMSPRMMAEMAANLDRRGYSQLGDRYRAALATVPADAKTPEAMAAMFAMGDRPVTPGLDMSPEARKQRSEAWRFPAGQTDAGRLVGSQRWYHGANRSDRIVKSSKFDPKRATSGPMAFFTNNSDVASNYAKSKPDTSMFDDGDIPKYFTVDPKALGTGGRTPIPAEQSWYFLTPDQKQTIVSRMRRVGYENIDEATGPWTLHPEGVEASLNGEHLMYLMRESRGNPLSALRKMWLEGGDLHGNEGDLAEIFRLAGYPHKISQETAPWYEAQGVLPVYLRMVNPIDTHNDGMLQQTVIPALEEKLKSDRTRRKEYGADAWDKNTRYTPKEWVAQLKDDTSKGINSYVWSSIPDKVTAALRELGFDGILDRGNKGGGGTDHAVAIPFTPQQVRSVNAAFDPANADSPNLMFAMGDESPSSQSGLDIPSLASRIADLARPYLDALRSADTEALARQIERDADGNVSAIVRDGIRYAVTRDGSGAIAGLMDAVSAALAEQQAAITSQIGDLIRQTADTYGVTLAPDRATALAAEALEIARNAPADPQQVIPAITDMVTRVAREIMTPAEPMFAMRDADGRPKPGAATRAAHLQADLAEIEARFQAASGDDRAKLQAKRAALLNGIALERLLDDAKAYKNASGQSDMAQAYMWLTEADAVRGGKTDVFTLKEVISGQFQQRIKDVIWEQRKGAISGDKRRTWRKPLVRDMEDAIRIILGEKVDNPIAAAYAKGITEAFEEARQRFNAAGGDIGKIKGGYVPQYHDPQALYNAGRDVWLADAEKTFNVFAADGRALQGAELRKVLREIFLTVTTDGASKLEAGAPAAMGSGALYKRHMEHRVLHAKSADLWIEYSKKYGHGDIYAMAISHLDMMARDIAAMERFGANPTVVRQRFAQEIIRQAAMAVPAKSIYDDLAEKVAVLKSKMRDAPSEVDRLMAEIGNLHAEIDRLRAEDQTSSLGPISMPRKVKKNAAAIEAADQKLFDLHRQFRDAFSKREMSHDAVRTFEDISAMMDEMAEMAAYPVTSRDPASRARRLVSRGDEMWKLYSGTTNTPIDAGVANFMSGFRNVAASATLPFASLSSVLSDPVIQVAARQFIGMPATNMMTNYFKAFTPGDRQLALAVGLGLDQARVAFAEQARYLGWFNTRGWTGYMVDRTHALSLLSPMTQALKVVFGLDFLSWMASLKETPFSKLDEPTRRMLARHDISPVEWEQIRKSGTYQARGRTMLTRDTIAASAGDDLAEKYMVMLFREQSRAILEGNARSRSLLISDSQPGTIIGEVARTGAMLKTFPTVYAMTIFGTLNNEWLAGRGLTSTSMTYGATVFVVGTLMGAMAMQMKNIGHGRDPEDMSKASFWGKAFMQSGGLGIFGDFIGSSVNRFGGGLAQTIAGPLAGRASTILDLTAGNLVQYANNEKTNVGRELTKAIRQWTPVLPFYLRTAYERMLLDELQRKIDPEAHKSWQSQVNALAKNNNKQQFYWRPGGDLRAPNLGAAFGQ